MAERQISRHRIKGDGVAFRFFWVEEFGDELGDEPSIGSVEKGDFALF